MPLTNLLNTLSINRLVTTIFFLLEWNVTTLKVHSGTGECRNLRSMGTKERKAANARLAACRQRNQQRQITIEALL